jgi:hypothetical protein
MVFPSESSGPIYDSHEKIVETGTASASFDSLPEPEMRKIVNNVLLRLNYGRLARVGSVVRRLFPPIRFIERFDCVLVDELGETGLASAARFLDKRQGREEAIKAAFIPAQNNPAVFTRVDFASAKFTYHRKLAAVYTSIFRD